MRGNTQGLTVTSAMRSRLRSREVSMRRQVGDAESMVNEEGVGRDDAKEEL